MIRPAEAPHTPALHPPAAGAHAGGTHTGARALLDQHWPLPLALGLYGLSLALLFALSAKTPAGQPVYALDDPYIHMAMAKNYAEHGIWGVTRYGFSSSTSSPLWTLLLALSYKAFGVMVAAPLQLNALLGVLALTAAYLILRRFVAPQPAFFLLLAAIFATPLPALAFVGMEHTLHGLLTLLFALAAARALSGETETPLATGILLALAALVTSIRYEGLFLLAAIAGLVFFRRGWQRALTLLGVGLAPVVLYGLISVWNGWYFLPNSVLLKSSAAANSAFVFDTVFQHPSLLLLLAAALLAVVVLLLRRTPLWSEGVLFALTFLATALLHLQFARTGWLYRYEAYLILFGVTALAVALKAVLPVVAEWNFGRGWRESSLLSALILLPILIVPLSGRAAESFQIIPSATRNIHEQHHQMAEFLRRYYAGQPVAANDIGAINFYADLDTLDLWGLGSLETGKRLMEGGYDSLEIDRLTRQHRTRIAVVYEYWFDELGGVPSTWKKAGAWGIMNNVIVAGNSVAFYAVAPGEYERLVANLQTFSPELPYYVVEFGPYTGR